MELYIIILITLLIAGLIVFYFYKNPLEHYRGWWGRRGWGWRRGWARSHYPYFYDYVPIRVRDE